MFAIYDIRLIKICFGICCVDAKEERTLVMYDMGNTFDPRGGGQKSRLDMLMGHTVRGISGALVLLRHLMPRCSPGMGVRGFPLTSA